MIKTDDQTNPQIAVLSTGGTEALIVDKAAQYAAEAEKQAKDAAESAKTSAANRDSTRLSAGEAAKSEATSQNWAEGTKPGGDGTYSSKEWADKAEGYMNDAKSSKDAAAESERQAKLSENAAAQSAIDAQTAVTEPVLAAAGVTIQDGKLCYVYYKEVEG